MSEEIKNTPTEYSADSIRVLEGSEAVRKEPSTCIGNTNKKGLHHLVYEVVDNSIDGTLAGYCTYIDVVINEDNPTTVADNDRGIPVDIHEKEGKPALEVVLIVLHAGGKFGKGTYKVSGGLHGMGVSYINALSTYLRMEIRRNGKVHMQEFSYGKPLHNIQVIDNTDKTGTTISFKPDGSISTVTGYRYDILATRLYKLAFLNVGIMLRLTGRRALKEDGSFKPEVSHSDEELKELVHYVDRSRKRLIPDVIHIVTEKQGIPVEVALTYSTSYNESVFSCVNGINMMEGDTYSADFRQDLTRMLKKYAEGSKLLEETKVEIQGDDFREGLTAVVSIKVAEPQFERQTKTKLGNGGVTGAVDMAIDEALGYYLGGHLKEAKIIIDRVILATQARRAARKTRELIQRKSPSTGGGLPGKLADCSSKDAAIYESFLVEGDSTGGTAKQGRNRNFQVTLSSRGKILNVEKAIDHKTFESEEIQNIYRAVGVTVGTEGDPKVLDMEKPRYHKVIIVTDADVDGSHIVTLVLIFFFRRIRSLIENGYVYLATPPLYLCKEGKAEEYCWTGQQRQQFILKCEGGNENSIHTQRYRGLGEMSDHQLWDTTMNLENHILKRITIDNAAEADQISTMLIGEDIGPRREFIKKNATYANIDA